MSNRLNGDLQKLNCEIEALSCKSDSIQVYVNEGLELLTDLDNLFLSGDYEDKRVLAGSLFTKKLIFGNSGCRTAQVNEVTDVLTRFSKGSSGCKKEKAAFLGDFSATVPPSEPNVNQILEDTRALAQIWDLYGHLLNETE